MKSKQNNSQSNFKPKKKEQMSQYVEWNFSKRDKKKPKERLRKDHPSFNIVMKLLDKFKANKEIKEIMPIKSTVRFIYAVYMGKAADIA